MGKLFDDYEEDVIEIDERFEEQNEKIETLQKQINVLNAQWRALALHPHDPKFWKLPQAKTK